MIFIMTFVLCINLVSLQPLSLLVRDCDMVEKVDIDSVVSFMNPKFPNSYDPATTCRWVFECHVGYACRLICRKIGLPLSEGCSMDKILVSTRSMDPTLDGSRVYCGGMTINAKSEGSRISMTWELHNHYVAFLSTLHANLNMLLLGDGSLLLASESSLGGRFMCTVKSEPSVFSTG